MNKKTATEALELTVSTTEVVKSEDFFDASQHSGMGLENTNKDSFAIPFLTLLQGLSPQIETLEGAKPGKFINTITDELANEVSIIPCAFQQRFVRWAPRATGGGYKGEYTPTEVATGSIDGMSKKEGIYMIGVPTGETGFDEKGIPKYDTLSDTRNHFCLVKIGEGPWKTALVSLSSTQIKRSKRWLTLIGGLELTTNEGKVYTPPSFKAIYKATPMKEDNAKGSWWSWSISLERVIEDEEQDLLKKAYSFHKQVMSGEVEVQQPQQGTVVEDQENF